jgi:CheY-like chemotaxis protein
MTWVDRPKVLVADDEQVIADTLATILNNSGYSAYAVYSGEMAIGKGSSFLPDMLISDVVMGGISGIEAAVKIRAMLPCCKVMLFSGQAATIDLLQKARDGGHAFELLLKPVHPKDLLEKLRIGLLSESDRPLPRGPFSNVWPLFELPTSAVSTS